MSFRDFLKLNLGIFILFVIYILIMVTFLLDSHLELDREGVLLILLIGFGLGGILIQFFFVMKKIVDEVF